MKIDRRPSHLVGAGEFGAGVADAPQRPAASAVPPGWPIWTAASITSLGWALGLGAFALRFGPLDADLLTLAPLLALWVGPVTLVWAAAGLLRQAQNLSVQSRRAEALADALLTPALVASARAGSVVADVRAEIDAAAAAADEARRTLLDLQASIAAEGQAMLGRTQDAAVATREAMAAAGQAARQSADDHVAAARSRLDELSETAFLAGQAANKVFEARLADARALVERSGAMVEETAASGSAKIAATAAAAQVALEDLDGMIGEVETRAGRLPDAMRVQAEQVRAVMVRSLGELAAQARRTADEAQAIDSAFQERIRRNFEMLSETVRLMGLVAAAPSPGLAPQGAPANDAAEGGGEPLSDVAALVESWARRPRLRLAPTDRDEALSSVFRTPVAHVDAGAPIDAEEDENGEDAGPAETWSWSELLASLEEPGGEPAELAESLTGELVAMSIDPAELLTAERVAETAALMGAGEATQAREAVRRYAPAAVRRLSRRIHTDEGLKRRAQAYLRRYQALTQDAPEAAPALLATSPGRLFLLLDAAVGELP